MSGGPIGREVIRLGTVGSTMDEAARLAAAGAPVGTVVVAAEQTAGRGRAGRPWEVPAGTALLCSILLAPPVTAARLGVLPLVLGVAVAETITAVTGLPGYLKWPNDVWMGNAIRGRKVAGILLTARADPDGTPSVIVGIGINVSTPGVALPAEATSLGVETGRCLAIEEVLRPLMGRLNVGYEAFVAADGAPSLDGWRARAALLNELVMVEVGGERRAGMMRGVDADGALLLERDGGVTERIVAGELVRGPKRHP